jgi:hypothetical protein
MRDLFYMGGTLFMSILTIVFVIMIAWYIYHLVLYYNPGQSRLTILSRMAYGRSIGLFAMVTGILGQLIGLYTAFSVLETAADISPSMVYAGLKVSMITTLYGIAIYLISLLIWFVAVAVIERREQ